MTSGLRIAGTAALLLALAGCDTSQGLGRIFSGVGKSSGPDEFAIVPTKPLEVPPSFTELPDPVPGGRNRVDQRPEHDAVAALGGRPERLDSPNIQPGEAALLAAAQRRGTAANIREVLAEEDVQERDRNGPKLLQRWFGTDTYFRTYDGQTLAARPEADRLRARGARVPVPPPDAD